MAASLLFPELAFLYTPATAPTRRLSGPARSLSGAAFFRRSYSYTAGIGVRTRVVRGEEDVLPRETRESELVEKLNGYPLNGNGAASSSSNGSASYYVDERESVEGNGSLVKYMKGNGAAASRLAKEVEVVEAVEEGRKRRIEEIGKEEAWFKQSGPQVEVK